LFAVKILLQTLISWYILFSVTLGNQRVRKERLAIKFPHCDFPSNEVHKSEEKTSQCPPVPLQAPGNYLMRQKISINYPMQHLGI
jgi:hypothetical protein